MTTKVLVVDNHDDIRRLFMVWFEGENGLHVVGGVRNGQEAIELLRKIPADVVLLDVDMPDAKAVAAIGMIRASFPDVCIIGISWDNSPERVAMMLDAGARAMYDRARKLESLIGIIHDSLA